MKHLLAQQPAVMASWRRFLSVAGRIVSVDGTAAEGLQAKELPEASAADCLADLVQALPAGLHLVAGHLVGQG